MPLGIFDSGVGGFTVLRRVLERHGQVPLVYLADTARVPYGNKHPNEIRSIASEVVQWLSDQDVSAVLVACNTTNSLALDVLENEAGVPVIGLIRSAAEMITEKRIGVLATPATVSSGAYRFQIESFSSNTFVFEQSCPDFVRLIEAGNLNSAELQFVAMKYLEPLLDAQVEAVVYGCSHYPLLEPLLKRLLPKEIRLVDPAIGLARSVDSLLGSPSLERDPSLSLASTRFCVTEDPSGFALKAAQWLGELPDIELISLQQKTCFF